MAELRFRDVDGDGGTGRDFRSAEAGGARRLAGTGSLAVGIEADLRVTDYRGRDELYFDAAELDLYLPVSRARGGWTVAAGPVGEVVRDLGGGSRDHLQWSARMSAERFLTGGGFVELDLEGGRRDYRGAGDTTIEISSLSSSLIRSDYWLLDLFAVLSLPVSPGVSLDLMASSSWEFHRARSERIQVTFVTLSAARRF